MENRYWQLLLTNWRNQGKNGLTIPFIIGSQNYLTLNFVRQDIRRLIVDVIENKEFPVYITYCQDVNDLIICKRDKSKERIAGRFPSFLGQEQDKFFQTMIVYNLGDSVEEIIESLTIKYQEIIDRQEYSIHDRIRGNFSSTDRSFIENSFVAL